MSSAASRQEVSSWLLENGPRELELLFRAVIYRASTAVVITDDDRSWRDASFGAAKLLGLPREAIIGQTLDDFAAPDLKPVIPERWQTFLNQGEQEGSLELLDRDGTLKQVNYEGKKNVLPVRHLLVLRDKTVPSEPGSSWVCDCALFLLDVAGRIATWYEGAVRIYGYETDEAVGRPASFLYAAEGAVRPSPPEELTRAASHGHFANEGWHLKKDGSRFWANSITMCLRDEKGELQGFARMVRDFTDCHERNEKLQRNLARTRIAPAATAIAGVVSGEYDRVPEANDTFLKLVGYSREDLLSGRLVWLDLTPDEFRVQEEFAHEEALRFGACTPFEKELICKDGSRVPVLVTTAVLKLLPFRWISFVTDLRERNREETIVEELSESSEAFEEIVGQSAPIRRMMGQVEVVAPTDATVLILGETGTGKELVARAIHRMSPRRKLPFISLNCAAIPTGLLESELFGYERGAFTGALAQKIGRFEMAHRGTLFLDEVGDIPIDLQPKLLRALQEKSFERLGGTRTIPIDVRLVAATNRNLAQMMGDKLFRSDLYYRLKVFPILTPALRDHAEDIPILARHFTRKYAAKMNREIDRIPTEIMKALVSWSWPGNVRELENFIERSVILSRGPALRAPVAELRTEAPAIGGSVILEDIERDHILRIFREAGGVISTAADRLGIPRTTLNAMMKKLGISRSDL